MSHADELCGASRDVLRIASLLPERRDALLEKHWYLQSNRQWIEITEERPFI